MKNNIYIIWFLFVLFLILFIFFINRSNLETYLQKSEYIDIIGATPIITYDQMYINSCDNECRYHGVGDLKCNYFTSTADVSNNSPGNCTLYKSLTGSTITPTFSSNKKLYYM
jgi:hypothetical protein